MGVLKAIANWFLMTDEKAVDDEHLKRRQIADAYIAKSVAQREKRQRQQDSEDHSELKSLICEKFQVTEERAEHLIEGLKREQWIVEGKTLAPPALSWHLQNMKSGRRSYWLADDGYLYSDWA